MISTHIPTTGCRVSARRLSRTLAWLALLAGVAAEAAGCGTSLVDARSVDNLQAALTSMPGVTDAWVYHEESYSQGLAMNVAVDVSTATPDQIAAVADRIRAVQLSLAHNYTQNVEFWVTSDRAVTVERHSWLDSRQIAEDSERLREMATGTDGRISWFRSDDGADSRLSFDESHSSGADLLNLVRRTIGQTAVTVAVSPSPAARQSPQMLVGLPLDPDAQRAVLDAVEAMPTPVLGLRVDHDAVSVLQVVVPGPDRAERDLLDVIAASRTVTARPLWLAWYFPTFAGRAPAFGGIVQVGECATVPAAVIHDASMRLGEDDATTLQSRMQSTIDDCQAPSPATAPSAGSPQDPPTTAVSSTPPVVPVMDMVAPPPAAPGSTTRDVTVSHRTAGSPCPADAAYPPSAGCPSGQRAQPMSARPPFPSAPGPVKVVPAAGQPPGGVPPAAIGVRPADPPAPTRRTSAARSDRRR